MKKSEAARYARWSAALALVCAGLTAGVYLYRGWTRHVERKNAPPAPAVNVERQSSLLTFSKVEQNQKIFTVEASKSFDFKGLNATDLEGVKITIFGKEGGRHDTMETHTCRYTKDSGDITCAGDVEIILMSKEEWEASAGRVGTPGTMKVVTRGVSFNRASGEAKTDQEVRFKFANGSGKAVGAIYHSEEGTLRLQRDVKLQLDQPVRAKGMSLARSVSAAKEPVEVTGSRMDFSRDEATIFLAGPAEAKTQTERLTSAGMLLQLDENFHAKRWIAKSDGKALRPEFSASKGAARQRLSADEIAVNFVADGWITHADATGQVSGEFSGAEETHAVTAQNASMEMSPGTNAPKLLTLRGDVDARTKTTANQENRSQLEDTRRLTAEEVRLAFAETTRGKGTLLSKMETLGRGRIEWTEAANAKVKASQTVVQADQLAMQFDAAGKASRLDAKGNVQTERSVEGADKQTATAKNGFLELQPQGGWSRMELNEKVRLNEGPRSAQADRAEFARADQTVTLTGHAMVKDATSVTAAAKLTFWQSTGDLRGTGGVRSSDLSARGGTVQLAPVAANISADQLTGNSKSGRALYAGHARLWQGDTVLEADSIELLKTERVLNASGSVRAVFPQAPRNTTGTSSAKQSTLWHVQSGNLSYWDRENRAKLEKSVVVQSSDEKISSEVLDLYFTRGNAGGQNKVSATGAQQISRAVATNGVTVQQGDRRATADRGEYTAADGKFVMSGGTPTIFDGSQGTTTGLQLTFFLTDATIIVDSENGSRTLTRHRVEQ